MLNFCLKYHVFFCNSKLENTNASPGPVYTLYLLLMTENVNVKYCTGNQFRLIPESIQQENEVINQVPDFYRCKL